MKRFITFAVLFLFITVTVLGAAISVNAEIGYGDHIFDPDRIMEFDEGTRFENGIVNGGIINPGLGTYSTYAGVKFEKSTYLGEDAVKVELLDGYTNGFFDFNYYQHNAAEEKRCLDASSYRYLKIRYAYVGCETQYYMKFWAAKRELPLGTAGSTMQGYWPMTRSYGEWEEVVLDLEGMQFSDGSVWQNNLIRQFRIHVFDGNSNPDAVCYIAGFGFFESEAKAEAYNFNLEDNFVDITYDANGGFSAPEADMKPVGGDVVLNKGIPGRLGHEFIGWSTSPSGEVEYLPGDKYTTDKSVVLYAQWRQTSTIEEGERIFDAERMMECEDGTHFRNGFLNGSVRSPKTNLYHLWQGVGFSEATYQNEPAIKVTLLNGRLEGFLDFNYYLYDDDEGYKPSLIAEKYPYFKIRYAYENAPNVYDMSLYAAKPTPVLGGMVGAEKIVRRNKANLGWNELVIDLRDLRFGDSTNWNDNIIREFRVKLFRENTNPDAVCYVAGMGFFETEEQAKTYSFKTDGYGTLIEYDANGGVGAPMSQVKEKTQDITLVSAVPAKPGYKFVGWSTSADGEVEYQPEDIYTADESIKLYAVWEVDSDGTDTMGEHIFEGERLVEFDEGTNFHNGFANGAVVNPTTGKVSTYAGVALEMTVHKNETAMKVSLLDGYTEGILDFNYYQWNAEKYEPSLNAKKYPYLRVRYAYENVSEIESMAFVASKDTPVLGTTIAEGAKRIPITVESEWQDVVVDLSTIRFGDNTSWGESTVRQFRFKPFSINTNPDAVCYIAGFGFFETEEEARNYVFNDDRLETPSNISGDVNSDGKITRVDLIRLTQYFANWAVDIYEFGADTNGDGKITRPDLIRLTQYFANWNVELGK